MTDKKTDNLGKMQNTMKDIGNAAKKKGEEALNLMANVMKKNPETQLVELIILMMIGLVVVIFVFWAYSLSSLQNRDCGNLDKIYSANNDHINSIAIYNPFSNISISKYTPVNALYDPSGGNARIFSYYVKTAHNCCSPGNFANSFVSLCALRHNISLGARCLDFEIYSLNLEPVISTSSQSDALISSFYIKETFNSLKLSDVLYYIKYFALESSNGGAPNFSDPLFLHFRIMTNKLQTLNLIAKYIREILGDSLLGAAYGRNNQEISLNNKSILEFCGKCIIMVNGNTTARNDELVKGSDLWSLTNIMTGTEHYKLLRYSDVKNMNASSLTDLTTFNKFNMTMVLPDVSHENINFDSTKCLRVGCQFIAMNFQTFDSYLETYFSVFGEVGFSFILKPCSLRWIPKHYLINSSKLVKGGGCTVSNTAGRVTGELDIPR